MPSRSHAVRLCELPFAPPADSTRSGESAGANRTRTAVLAARTSTAPHFAGWLGRDNRRHARGLQQSRFEGCTSAGWRRERPIAGSRITAGPAVRRRLRDLRAELRRRSRPERGHPGPDYARRGKGGGHSGSKASQPEHSVAGVASRRASQRTLHSGPQRRSTSGCSEGKRQSAVPSVQTRPDSHATRR